jgi:hypothetical protein
MDDADQTTGGNARPGAPDGEAVSGVEPWTGVRVAVGSRVVAYLWEWIGDRPHRLRVLRSRRGFAAGADEGWQGVGGQLAVYEGEGTSLRDAGLAPLNEYFYTFFVRDDAGAWRELLRDRLSTVADEAPPKGKPLLADGGRSGEGTLAALSVLADLTDLLLP